MRYTWICEPSQTSDEQLSKKVKVFKEKLIKINAAMYDLEHQRMLTLVDFGQVLIANQMTYDDYL
jgi:hypothetical protein